MVYHISRADRYLCIGVRCSCSCGWDLVIGWGLERLGLGSLVMGGLVESDGSFRSMLRRLVLVGWLVRRRDGR